MLNARQYDIIEFLKENKRASVKKLSCHFYVSEMTVRRDLKELEKQGYLKRYNGGAIYNVGEESLPIESRMLIHKKEKDVISRESKKYLHDGMSVFIDSSSTCTYIISSVAEYKDIKIVTNSVQNLLAASKYHIPCILAGGNYYEHDMCTVGGITEDFLSGINVDISFFSVMGISDDGVISDNDENQTAVRKVVMKNSKKNIFMFDKEKLHKKYLYTLCKTDDAYKIIIL